MRLIALTLTLALVTACSQQNLSNVSTSMRQDFLVREQDFPKLSEQALGGSAHAARKIALHYEAGVADAAAARGWWRIAAENGDALGMLVVGQQLLESGDQQSVRRGRYWLTLSRARAESTERELLVKIDALLLGVDESAPAGGTSSSR